MAHQAFGFFVHTGKCGGGSILQGLQRHLGELACIFEYHCLDSRDLIYEVLNCTALKKNKGKIFWVVADRDPLERWVSSYNWDIYNKFLRDSKPLSMGFEAYPSLLALVHGLLKNESKAFSLARDTRHHMGMGISWYLPEETLEKLSLFNIYRVSMENINHDFSFLISSIFRSLGKEMPALLPLAMDKHGYKSDPKVSSYTFNSTADISTHASSIKDQVLGKDYEISSRIQALQIRRII